MGQEKDGNENSVDKSGEFNFEDNGQPIEQKKEGTPPDPDKKSGRSTINLAHLIGKETLNWIKGDMEGKPQEIKQLGEDFAQKLNWYIGCTILAQYARIPSLFEALETVSEKLFENDTLQNVTDTEELVDYYNSLSKEIMQVMEFARRFVVQNKDYLVDNSNFFDRSLFEKIKSLPIDAVKDYLTLFQIVEQKGQQVLKDIIDKYK